MTDEEMADQYIQNDALFVNNKVTIKSVKLAFLAGLEAGKDMAEADLATVAYMQGAERYKPKWHKVADGDLPKKEQLGKSFTVAFAFNEMTHEYYSFDCAEYIDKGKFCTHTNNDDKVIAWCEIPKFEEKKNDTGRKG